MWAILFVRVSSSKWEKLLAEVSVVFETSLIINSTSWFIEKLFFKDNFHINPTNTVQLRCS